TQARRLPCWYQQTAANVRRRSPLWHVYWRIILLLVCLVGSLPAQFETATVLGTVKDRTDAVISASRVILTNVETNISAVKDSDENGNFEFVNVKPGRYTLTADKSGFSQAKAENFTVNVGAR